MNGENLARGHQTPAGPPVPPSPAPLPVAPAAPPAGPGTQVAGSAASMPGPAEPTGDPRVDELLTGLADLRGRPVGDHVAVYERLHHGLQEVLAATGHEGEGADGQGPFPGRVDSGRRDGPVSGPRRPGGHGPGDAGPGRLVP